MKKKILSIVLFLGVLAPAASLLGQVCPPPKVLGPGDVCVCPQQLPGLGCPPGTQLNTSNCQCVCTGTCPVNHEVLTSPPCCRFRGFRGHERSPVKGPSDHPKHE